MRDPKGVSKCLDKKPVHDYNVGKAIVNHPEIYHKSVV